GETAMHPSHSPLLSSRVGAALRLGSLIAGILVVVAGTLPCPVTAQPGKPEQLSLFLSFQRDGKRPEQDTDPLLQLRPNVLQAVYVLVHNAPDKDRTVTVQLLADGKVETAQEVKAVAGKSSLVPFALPPAAAKTAGALTALGGVVGFRMVEGNAPVGKTVPLFTAEPRVYVQATATFYPGDDKSDRTNR